LLDLLLAGVGGRDLLGAPVHAVGEQHRPAQSMTHQAQPCGMIESELQMPMPVLEVQLIVD
jgi:hypothetical protein